MLLKIELSFVMIWTQFFQDEGEEDKKLAVTLGIILSSRFVHLQIEESRKTPE